MLGLKRSRKAPLPVTYEPGIPPPGINYNQSETTDSVEYVRNFKQSACLRELPFLMRVAGLKPKSAMLDYGCGLGRLAYAASKYLAGDGVFYGYEPNQTALEFLKTAYSGRKNFFFSGKPLPRDEDYVAIERDEAREGGVSAQSLDLTHFIGRPIDVQWSCSVFTHMWADSIVSVLSNIAKVLDTNGLCVNTWLCVDDFAAYAMRCGVTDRQLPHRANGALTYSLNNPLVCAAYELPTMRDIYERAGHRIEDIRWGSWSGRDNGVIYQDIVISRPAR